jgi:hypothetical protein
MTHLSRDYKSEAKSDWRGLNATAIRRVGIRCPRQTLVDRSGKLQGRMLDLAGENTADILEAYRGLLRSPSKLLLVDYAWDTYLEGVRNISHLSRAERPRVLLNDAYHLAYSINQRTHEKDKEELIGVFSLDLLNYAGSNWWATEGSRFIEYAVMPAVKEYKACVLLLNHTLDGRDGLGHGGADARLETHIDGLCRVLASKFNSGVGVPRGLVLPEREEVRARIFDGSFTGWLNRVHIYRSRVLRMATLRLYLQSNSFHVCSKEDLS